MHEVKSNGHQKGQTTIEVLLLAVLGFILVGAVIGTGKRDGGGIPATMKRAAPVLGMKLQENLETGKGYAEAGGSSAWKAPPP